MNTKTLTTRLMVMGAGLCLLALPALRLTVGETLEAGNVPAVQSVRYLNPIDLELSPDGKSLFVVCEDADQVLKVDTRTQQVVARAVAGRKPEGVAVSPDGKSVFVSSEWNNSVNEYETQTLHLLRTLQVGWGPVGVTTDRQGRFLYTANTQSNDVSVVDLGSGKEVKRLDAGHFPEYVALSRDGSRVYVSNLMTRIGPYDRPPVSQLIAIDTAQKVVASVIEVPGVIEMRHIAELPAVEGGYLLIPVMRPKNLNPLIQIEQGGYLTHGLAVVKPVRSGEAGRLTYQVNEVLLDDIDHYYADGFGAAVSPDGKWGLITASGANRVAVLNLPRLTELLKSPNAAALPDRLDSARQFVVKRMAAGRNPTAVAITPDGRFAYVTNRLDDNLSLIDLTRLQTAAVVDLGGPRVTTPLRHGEQAFYDSRFSYQRQFACATCHPHGGLSDGLAWNLETPMLGRDRVQNRDLRDIAETSPYKWNGKNINLETQDGPRSAMYIFRSEGLNADEVRDLTNFIRTLPLDPPHHLGQHGELTAAQKRGRDIFFRTTESDGTLIPPEKRCYYCHPPQTHYTSRVQMDVGTASKYDTIHEFDVPQLERVSERAPYLHNGEALSLEEIWTIYNNNDQHGVTSDMDKTQLNDLIEFLKTL